MLYDFACVDFDGKSCPDSARGSGRKAADSICINITDCSKLKYFVVEKSTGNITIGDASRKVEQIEDTKFALSQLGIRDVSKVQEILVLEKVGTAVRGHIRSKRKTIQVIERRSLSRNLEDMSKPIEERIARYVYDNK
jgi:hypothetical protein